MSDSVIFEGGCRCGNIRYRVSGVPQETAICHCEQCRRVTGSLCFSGVGDFPANKILWEGGKPKLYLESPIRGWSFCPDCGSTIARQWLDDEITWLCIGTLDNPDIATPRYHMFTEEQISWFSVNDGLPRYPKYPSGHALGTV